MDLSNLDLATMDPVWLATAGVVVVALVVGLSWALLARRRSSKRSQRLQGRFHGEYERATEADGRKQAERDLEHRLVQHRDVEFEDLAASEADHFARQEDEFRRSFVDEPRDAARALTQAVVRVATARGYAALDGGVLDLVSVDHPEAVAALRRSIDDLDRAEGGQVTDASRRLFLDAGTLADRLLDDGRAGRGPLTEDPAARDAGAERATGDRLDDGPTAGPEAEGWADDGPTAGPEPTGSDVDEVPHWRESEGGRAVDAAGPAGARSDRG